MNQNNGLELWAGAGAVAWLRGLHLFGRLLESQSDAQGVQQLITETKTHRIAAFHHHGEFALFFVPLSVEQNGFEVSMDRMLDNFKRYGLKKYMSLISDSRGFSSTPDHGPQSLEWYYRAHHEPIQSQSSQDAGRRGGGGSPLLLNPLPRMLSWPHRWVAEFGKIALKIFRDSPS